jgi:uncharacterized delta-60 repeat protein
MHTPNGHYSLGMRRYLASAALIIGLLSTVRGADPGALDLGFAAGGLPDASVWTMARQPDQKLIIGGSFTRVGEVNRKYVARLNPDGSVDNSFDPGDSLAASINALAIQGDGKILVGGSNAGTGLVRLNADGSLDSTFTAGNVNGEIRSVKLLANGKILVGGSFTSYNGVTTRAYLLRLHPDGTLDSAFNANLNNVIEEILPLTDGKILIGGAFTEAGGAIRQRIARLNSEGSADVSFEPGAGPNSTVDAMEALPDGKILIGGRFGTVNGAPISYLARLHANGLPDLDFNGNPGHYVYAIARQPDGRIVVGGEFPGKIARLRSNGTRDLSFDVGSGANTYVACLDLEADGDIVVGGTFAQFNATDRKFLVRVGGLKSALGGEVEFSTTEYRLSEAQPSVIVDVVRNGNTGAAITVDLATETDTANAGDYFPKTEKLSFAAGEIKKTVTISLRDDEVVEDEESFRLKLSNPTGGAELGPESIATIKVTSDDNSTAVGSIDTALGLAAQGSFSSLALAPDGKIVLGGDFRQVDGQSRYNMARINADGRIDPTFSPAAWADAAIYKVVVQPDGKVLVGGAFTVLGGVPRQYIGRFNVDGSVDTGFNTVAPNSHVYSLLLLPVGDMLVGGSFSQFGRPQDAYLVKLFSDGSLDPSFNPQVNGAVLAVAQQVDGKIIIGGDFTLVRGQKRNRVARLNLDGTLDASFDPGAGPNTSVRAVAIGSDGRILIGGSFSLVNGSSIPYVARLTTNGLPDLGFINANLSRPVHALELQPDGAILIGADTVGLARLKRNGGIDPAFDLGTGANGAVTSLALQSDGYVLAGGTFGTFNDFKRGGLVRVRAISAAGGGELQFSSASFRGNEAQETVSVEVRRSGNVASAVSVDLATSPGTAMAGDFVQLSTKVNFAANEVSKTVPIRIRPDTTVEDDETLAVTLSNPTGGAELGAQRTAEVVLVNDDAVAGIGAVEIGFGRGINDGAIINALAVGEDGRITLGGDFRGISGESRVNLTRVHADGQIDNSFYPALWLDGAVLTLAQQEDGKTMLGGAFYNVSGNPRSFLARVHQDGTFDDSFTPAAPNSVVYSILMLPFGDLLVGGAFTSYGGDSARIGLVRLFGDGSLDTSFNPRINSTVWAIARQPDEKILIAGDFTQVNGQPRNRVARLFPDGTLDPAFNPAAGPNSTVRCIVLQGDGKILIGGSFTVVNGRPIPYIARLNSNGLPDSAFSAAINSTVHSLGLQPDGRILVGGDFQNRLARLRSDGSGDPTFDIGTGANNSVMAILVQPDGNILVSGSFTSFNGFARNGLMRLQGLSTAVGGEIEFAAPEYSVAEGLGSVSVEVRRYGNADAIATVDYSTQSETATAGDYAPQNGTLVFGAGEVRKTLTITILPDVLVEDTEAFNLSLTNTTGGADLGSHATAVVSILNDDFSNLPGTIDVKLGGIVGGNYLLNTALGDGSILMTGDFQSVYGESRLNIARLKSDGTFDGRFSAQTWFNGATRAAAIQGDRKILIGGDFTIANGVPRNYIARLNPDGTLDPAFDPGVGPNSHVYSLVLLPSGEMLVAGLFNTYNGENRWGLVRLFSDGRLDPTFNPQLDSSVWSMERQQDGKILIGGQFTTIAGRSANRIARLNADGSLDISFNPGSGANSLVGALALQPDGKIIVGGHFTQFAGENRAYLVRLGANGGVDESFLGTVNGPVQSLRVDSASMIHVGGAFSMVNGTNRAWYVKLKPDGSIAPETADLGDLNGPVFGINEDENGRIILTGQFTQLRTPLGPLNKSFLLGINGERATSSPARIQELTRNATGFRIRTSGGRAGSIILQGSTDLLNWSEVANQTGTEAGVSFDDNQPVGARRFYRLLLP